MKKKILAVVMSAAMVFGLAACGTSDKADKTDNAKYPYKKPACTRKSFGKTGGFFIIP